MRTSLLLLPLALMACSDTDDTDSEMVHSNDDIYMVEYEFTPSPVVAGETLMKMDLTTVDGAATVEGAALVVTPWMPSMDHGIMGDVTITDMGEGTYQAEWAFSMPGLWEVTIDIDAEPGTDAAVFDIDVE